LPALLVALHATTMLFGRVRDATLPAWLGYVAFCVLYLRQRDTTTIRLVGGCSVIVWDVTEGLSSGLCIAPFLELSLGRLVVFSHTVHGVHGRVHLLVASGEP